MIRRRSRVQRAAGRQKRGGRLILKCLLVPMIVVLAIGYVFWDADWWLLRDKIEHVRSALFGRYIKPECRLNPKSCAFEHEGGRLDKRNPAATKRSSIKPGLELHHQLQSLYDDFNARLFDDRLPGSVITLQRKRGAAGYFAYRRFRDRNRNFVDEIALNPQWFGRVSMLRLTSTLAHEMCHQEVAHFGSPSKNGFHTMQWARCMLRIGLHPSTTGKPGGRMTGMRVTHYIVEGGQFERIAKRHPLVGAQRVPLSEQ